MANRDDLAAEFQTTPAEGEETTLPVRKSSTLWDQAIASAMAACRMEEPVCIMEYPVCLIESDSKGKLRVVPEALEIFQQIEQKVVVVSIVGLYRTGKSYLMNRLAGKNKGFPLGATVVPQTRGIWMWCVPHPRKTDHTLVLLDTEGLGDVKKGNTKRDNWIFAMAVLLSSTLVYNSMGTIDNKALENLHYVTELTKNVKIKSNTEKDDHLTMVKYLPSFVWTVRDFSLDLEIDGKEHTADEYLEHSLKEIPDGLPQYNEPRACLRKFFLPRHCFVFVAPGKAKIMKRMEEITDKDLDEDFVEQANKFTEHIYTKSGTKYVGDGVEVTGRLLVELAEMYVEAIRNGEVPCLENAVVALAEVENTKAVEQARDHYVQRMKSKVRFPTNTLEELSAIHLSSEKEALELFMKRSFRDDNQEYQKKLAMALKGEQNKINEENINESREVCKEIIQRVFKPLEDSVRAALYTVPGGYEKFIQDLQEMTAMYKREKGKGVMAEGALKTYLDEKAKLGQNILEADKNLTEAQKREKEEKAKREKAEREKRAAEEHQKALKVEMAQQKKTQEEHVRQLNEKMEKQKKEADDKHAKLMANLAEQEEKAKRAEKLGMEAQRKALELEREIQANKQWWKDLGMSAIPGYGIYYAAKRIQEINNE